MIKGGGIVWSTFSFLKEEESGFKNIKVIFSYNKVGGTLHIPESTRKSRPDRVSRTNRREGQLISEAEDKVSHSILAKEQGFLQLNASSPCFL